MFLIESNSIILRYAIYTDVLFINKEAMHILIIIIDHTTICIGIGPDSSYKCLLI